MSLKHKNTLVLGLGNPVMGDDRIGLMLVEDLQKVPSLNQNVRFQTSTQAGLYLLDLLIGFYKVVFIDSVICPAEKPGQIKCWSLPGSPSHVQGSSPHYIGVSSMIEIGKRLHLQMPQEMWLIGINIRDALQIGEKLSPDLKKQYGQILSSVQSLLEKILRDTQALQPA